MTTIAEVMKLRADHETIVHARRELVRELGEERARHKVETARADYWAAFYELPTEEQAEVIRQIRELP